MLVKSRTQRIQKNIDNINQDIKSKINKVVKKSISSTLTQQQVSMIDNLKVF